MSLEFIDLAAIAQHCDLRLLDALTAQAIQYHNATTSESFNLLKEVAESQADESTDTCPLPAS